MMKWMLAAGAAALAIASPGLADPKGNKGGGGGDKGGQKAHSGHVMKADKGNKGGGQDQHQLAQFIGPGGARACGHGEQCIKLACRP